MKENQQSAAGRVGWTASHMSLLAEIGEQFSSTRPFEGHKIGVSIHIEPKTAVLLEVLKEGGAEIVAAGNYGTTQDSIVEYLRDREIDARGTSTDSREEHLAVVSSVAAERPTILLDNGADLAADAARLGIDIVGGTEETTSGHTRLNTELSELVTFPVIVINDSPLKAIGENEHAVGQSVYESFCRHTNLMPQGKRFVVVGYGWCGRGVAHYARANGAHVAVAEVNEIKQLEAFLAGFEVGELAELVSSADVVVTVTGAGTVLTADHINAAKSGVILANAGHFPDEIDVAGLKSMATGVDRLGDSVERYHVGPDRYVDLVTGGRMMNLTGPYPKGNTIESMDLGFAMQARSLERIATSAGSLKPGPQPVPGDINRELARRFVQINQG